MGWWGSDRIDSQLEKVLARVEGRHAELWIKGEYGGFSLPVEVKLQELVLSDSGPWSMMLKFVQDTEDGKLAITVGSNPHTAWVSVRLGDETREPLTDLRFRDGRVYGEDEHAKKSRVTVDHVRKWVRERALPELAAASKYRAAIEQQRVAELKAMRKKYL